MIYAQKQTSKSTTGKRKSEGEKKKTALKQATSTARGYGAAAFSLFGFTGSVACIKGIKMLLYKIRMRDRTLGRALKRVPSGCCWGQPLIPDNDAIITPRINNTATI